MKVLVGGTYRDFRDWLYHNRVLEQQVVWADRPEKLLGLELAPEDVVRLGTLTPAMEELLQTRIRRVGGRVDK